MSLKKKITPTEHSLLSKFSFPDNTKVIKDWVKHCVTGRASKMGKSKMNWRSWVFIYTNKRAEHNLVASGIFHRH